MALMLPVFAGLCLGAMLWRAVVLLMTPDWPGHVSLKILLTIVFVTALFLGLFKATYVDSNIWP